MRLHVHSVPGLSEENLNGMHLNALKKGFRVIIFRFSSENEFASIIKIDMNSSKHEDHIEHKKSRKWFIQ